MFFKYAKKESKIFFDEGRTTSLVKKSTNDEKFRKRITLNIRYLDPQRVEDIFSENRKIVFS
jgi:hypothetical protein